MDSLAFSSLPHTNFMAFYSALVDRFIALDCARLSGEYKIDHKTPSRENRQQRLAACHELEGEISELCSALCKETQFNRKVELNTKIKRLEQRLRRQVEQL